MPTKKGRKLPKMGSLFPPDGRDGDEAARLTKLIAAALHADFATEAHAVKTVMTWTDASDRTVKNWFSGVHGPSGAHLVALARHSKRVHDVYLELTNRDPHIAVQAAELRAQLIRMVDALDAHLQRQH